MEPLNDQLRSAIPELACLASDPDDADRLVHLAADGLVQPSWDDSAKPLSSDPSRMTDMRRRLWTVMDERLSDHDPVARTAFERWLLGGFVRGEPVAISLKAEMPAGLQRIVERYDEECGAFVASLRSIGPAFDAAVDDTIALYDGLVLLTSILDALSNLALPSDRTTGAAEVSAQSAQVFLDALENEIDRNGYIDEAIRETVVANMRYANVRGEVAVGPRFAALTN